MGSKLKAAVIGVGRMGKNHARIYDALPGVELAAIVDEHMPTAKRVSEKYRCKPYLSLRVMLNSIDIDVASVVTPTIHHFEHAKCLIDRGVSVLVEKPLAHTVEHAECLYNLATNPRINVAVGHIERCNPAVRLVKELIESGEIGEVFRISTRRVGPSPQRIRDVGVTQDLAVHDLDIMRYLSGKEPVGYSAMVQHRRHNGFDDSVNAVVRLEDGIIGVLECDWLTPAKRRTLTIVGSKGMIEAYYLTQKVIVSQEAGDNGTVHWIVKREPLLVEIEEFLEAVRGYGKPAATAYDGYMAVRMAHALLERGNGQS